MRLKALLLFLLSLGSFFVEAQNSTNLTLKKGDHIALVGNALPDRFQHSGWLETLVHARFPDHQLVIRNLAAAGDEVAFRHRSENFGTPDDWLKRTQADVIWAFFGFNESFKGPEGLDKFKQDLDKYLKEILAKSFSDRGPTRVVLFSPIANEKHSDPNFQDPAGNNANIQLYTAAMAEEAARNKVQFVNLFQPSQKLFAASAAEGKSLTVNGVYLTDEGDRRIAPVIFQNVFGEPAPEGNFKKLREIVNEKNAQWHGRYRTIDGYNVYGGRSKLSFESGKGGPQITNYKVMQEEMGQRDVLTANRDKRVWAVARGADLVVDDSNLPSVTQVETNKRGTLPDGSHTFLGGEAAIAKMTIHSGMKVNLFASEEQFPELVAPVQMAWDTRGRLWVAAWLNYPGRAPTSKTGDSLLIFEDTDGDGKADKCTHFADDLNGPTGFQFYKDGVLVMQAPDLWFMRDTNGDSRADTKERVLMGLDSADSHHTANAICLDPGGAIYLSDGVFHRTQVETGRGPVRNNDAAIYRFEPSTGRFETYISYGFANPHGRVFDAWGNDIVTDATGNANYFGAAFSGHIDYPSKHPGMKEFWNRPSRPCPGTGILTSRHFPEEFQGNFLNVNVISFQGIYRVKMSDEGSGVKGESLENLISSSDPNFRPSAVSVGPDGAIYITDWHNPIIGHMQHHLRDPNRDHGHGRIYRMTYEGRPLLKPAKIRGESVANLVKLLAEPENQTRELAKVELGTRPAKEVVAAVKKWATTLDKNDPAFHHHLMEVLWVHQWMNVVDVPLLKQMFNSPEPKAWAAAARVLCYWRDRVPDSLSLFKTLAGDPHPRVRLEAVRAASFYKDEAATDVALGILKHPTDYYLDYTLRETLRQLEPSWRQAIASGRPISTENVAGIDYLISRVSTSELLKMQRTDAVLESILIRAGVTDADRMVALDALATARKTSRSKLLLSLLETRGKSDLVAAGNLAHLLPFQLAEDLKPLRAQVMQLARNGDFSDVKSSAWAALAVADNSFAQVWKEASPSATSLTDLLNGIPTISDITLRAQAFPFIKPLLVDPSPEFKALTDGKQTQGARFLRIELPRNGTLTLAEVQILSGGKNIAPQGKSKQSSTSNGGEASRATDGRTDGAFSSGTQTHTQEMENNPWWEIDLGTEHPVESVVVWNRTEGDIGKRLEGFTLTLLDTGRQTVFQKLNNPAPAPSLRVGVFTDSTGGLRRAAIRAIASLNEQPEAVFKLLAALISKGEQQTTAAQGLRSLPRNQWPKTGVGAIAQDLVAWAKKVPASQRTSRDYVETIQFATDLAGFLPPDQAGILRSELKNLRVAVYIIRTVREQMRYDTPRIVVEAGKAIEIIVENADFMPHNLAIVQPGSREKVSLAAALMKPEQTDGRGRAYIPAMVEVIAATKLLEAGQSATLSITAPNNEGDYDYVCTFPEHAAVMWGRMVVTKNVDDYLQSHPQPPPIGTGTPIGTEHKHD